MGIDNAHIYNHNIVYRNADKLCEEIEQRTGFTVFNHIFNEDHKPENNMPEGFSRLVISTEDSLTVEDYIQQNMLLEFSTINMEDSGYFYINPFVIENSLPEAYLFRWGDTVQMCELIRQSGLKSFEEYDVFNNGGAYVLKHRRQIQSHLRKMDSTAMLTFCADYHPIYIDHIEANWTFEDFISWGKKDFIYVDFKDLSLFVFPKKKPDMYNVFIYDDFADL